MRILIAEDDRVSRAVLEGTLKGWGHEVVIACDGQAAWNLLQQEDAPKLAILDWMMPGMDGVELCRRLRGLQRSEPTYVILLTARHRKEDIVAGLDSGANDFIAKPFDRSELKARTRVGERVTILQRELADRVRALEAARDQVNQLCGLLPICSYCKSVRDDKNYWQQVDDYLLTHSDVRFTHGICPDCYRNAIMVEAAAAAIKFGEEHS